MKTVDCRLTDEEYAELEATGLDANMSVEELVRHAVEVLMESHREGAEIPRPSRPSGTAWPGCVTGGMGRDLSPDQLGLELVDVRVVNVYESNPNRTQGKPSK